MTEAEKQAVAKLIEQEQRRPGTPTIERVKETRFFDAHNNTFDGYFVWVKYPDGVYEIFFVVDIRGGLSDDDWFIESIT